MSSEGLLPALDVPEVGKAEVFFFFVNRARLHAAAGDGDHALDDIRFLTGWCRLHEKAPRSLMSVVIRMGMAAVIASAAWDIAAQPSMTGLTNSFASNPKRTAPSTSPPPAMPSASPSPGSSHQVIVIIKWLAPWRSAAALAH